MKRMLFVFLLMHFALLLPVFAVSANGITLEEDCRIERISGQFSHRLRCFSVVPDLLFGYLFTSGIFGGILAGGGYVLERKFEQPKKYKKLTLVILFLLPFILSLFL